MSRRKPGFSLMTKSVILIRDRERCRRCESGRPADIHHRLPRRMGGTGNDRQVNGVANGVVLCRVCHDWVESNRAAAYLTGWLLQADTDPEKIPVTDLYGRIFYFDAKGRAIQEVRL